MLVSSSSGRVIWYARVQANAHSLALLPRERIVVASSALPDAYWLPDGDGHELQPVPAADGLLVTTGRHVYLFDPANGASGSIPTWGPRQR